MSNTKGDGNTWTITTAKAQLSKLMRQAQSAPQTITRYGKPTVVVVFAQEWERRTTRRGTLARFLLDSPLRAADLDLERQHDDRGDVPL